jgi:hypothetical protein
LRRLLGKAEEPSGGRRDSSRTRRRRRGAAVESPDGAGPITAPESLERLGRRVTLEGSDRPESPAAIVEQAPTRALRESFTGGFGEPHPREIAEGVAEARKDFFRRTRGEQRRNHRLLQQRVAGGDDGHVCEDIPALEERRVGEDEIGEQRRFGHLFGEGDDHTII